MSTTIAPRSCKTDIEFLLCPRDPSSPASPQTGSNNDADLANPVDNVMKLPSELLFMIFSYLDPFAPIRYQTVARDWHRRLSDPDLVERSLRLWYKPEVVKTKLEHIWRVQNAAPKMWMLVSVSVSVPTPLNFHNSFSLLGEYFAWIDKDIPAAKLLNLRTGEMRATLHAPVIEEQYRHNMNYTCRVTNRMLVIIPYSMSHAVEQGCSMLDLESNTRRDIRYKHHKGSRYLISHTADHDTILICYVDQVWSKLPPRLHMYITNMEGEHYNHEIRPKAMEGKPSSAIDAIALSVNSKDQTFLVLATVVSRVDAADPGLVSLAKELYSISTGKLLNAHYEPISPDITMSNSDIEEGYFNIRTRTMKQINLTAAQPLRMNCCYFQFHRKDGENIVDVTPDQYSKSLNAQTPDSSDGDYRPYFEKLPGSRISLLPPKFLMWINDFFFVILLPSSVPQHSGYTFLVVSFDPDVKFWSITSEQMWSSGV